MELGHHNYDLCHSICLEEIPRGKSIYCMKCGKKNKYFHEYCYFCGADLNKAKNIIQNKYESLELTSKFKICPYCKEKSLKKYKYCSRCGYEFGNRSRYIPKQVRKRVWQRDKGRCVECGTTENLQYDHIIPFSKGGANTVENIQILCERCNKRKYNKIDG